MFSSRSSQFHANGSPREHHRSSSRRLSSRRSIHAPERTQARKGSLLGGVPQEGEPVQIFSRSSAAWVDGFIAGVENDNFLWVEYKVGNDWCGKMLHKLSEHLAPAIMMDGPPLEENDPGVGFLWEGFLFRSRSQQSLRAGEYLLGTEVEFCKSAGDYIDVIDPEKMWKKKTQRVVQVRDADNLHYMGSSEVRIRLSKDIEVDEDLTRDVECAIKSADGRVLETGWKASLGAAADVDGLSHFAGHIEAEFARRLHDGEGKLSSEFSVPLLRIALKEDCPPANPVPYVSEAIMGFKGEVEISAYGSSSTECGVGMEAEVRPGEAKAGLGSHLLQKQSPCGYKVHIKNSGGPEIKMVHEGKTMQEVLTYFEKWLKEARKQPQTWRVLWVRVSNDESRAQDWKATEFLRLIAAARSSQDKGKTKCLLKQVAESNYVLRNTWKVPRTISVTAQKCSTNRVRGKGRDPKVSFSLFDTADAIRNLAQDRRRRICALNFANGKRVGGGYKNGAQAQEEDLCRRIPSLYTSLNNAKRDGQYPFGPCTCKDRSDPSKYSDVLYTKGLVIARAGEAEGFALLRSDEQVMVSLVTAAAPNVNFARELYDLNLMYETIKTIFVAPVLEEKEINTLVLGAWGCGAFGGDPEQISELFVRAITDGLGRLYKEVHFAIPEGRNANVFWAALEKNKVRVVEIKGSSANSVQRPPK